MKITYTGRHVDFKPEQLSEIETQFQKLGRLLDGNGEREAHVRLSHERHIHNAEVTVNYHHHSLVATCSDPDPYQALHDAVLKLEKQAHKVRDKWREGFRGPKAKDIETNGDASIPLNTDNNNHRAANIHNFRLKNTLRPMTLDEALMELDGRLYVAYCDARTQQTNLLIRREDGDLDLLEV